MNEIKREIASASAEDAAANQRVIPSPEVMERDGMESAPEGDMDDYDAAKADVNDQIGTLKRKLSTVLRARQQTYFQGDKDDGSIDPGALYGLKTGERRVFAQQTIAESANTAITLLVDLSGSMASPEKKGGHSRSYYAKRTAIALAETLDAVGVSFEVLGFHNDASEDGDYYKHGTTFDRWSAQNGGATRFGPFRIRPFKLFTDRLRRVRDRFSTIDDVGGHNGDGDALMFAAKRLATRPELRKMLIVISDGLPEGPAPSALLRKQLHEVIREITDAGIETYGIGAGYAGVREYYCAANGAQSVVINDLTKLAVSVFKLIRSHLLTRKSAA
jgi:cobaltochelatase CobT